MKLGRNRSASKKQKKLEILRLKSIKLFKPRYLILLALSNYGDMGNLNKVLLVIPIKCGIRRDESCLLGHVATCLGYH